MIPYVFGTKDEIKCFDEESPCLLEQTSMCVIDIAQKNDATSAFPGQDAIIPWHICMDTNGGDVDVCHSQVGILKSDVDACLNSRAQALVADYLERAKDVHSTPTVMVNDNVVDHNAAAVSSAICAEEPSLQSCSSSPSGQCHALSPVVTDDWCTANCHAGNCPANLCLCDGFELI